jgi:mannose/cellobiose epimerase-like protein (N-acyl-D-glucosamine 2-epimerase family)
MVGLFRERFVATPDTGLAEYFDARLRTAPGADGAVREPGHHFEWIWLLKRWQEASDDRQAAADAERLWRIACATGVDVDEFAFDVVDAEGRIVADTKLLWPQTELLKARCARFESTGDESQREGAARTLTGLDTYFAGAEPGLWHNQLDRSRRPLAVPTLSRVLYHLFVALAETRRVFGDTPAR